MQVRIITPEGVVSKEIYTQSNEEIDEKGRITLDTLAGGSQPVHKQRIVPVDAYKKAVMVEGGNGAVIGICPTCLHKADMAEQSGDGQFSCPEHGVFDTVGDVIIKPIRRDKKPKKKKETKNVTETTKVAKRTPAAVDWEEIKKYGELWTKERVNFDHPTVDVKAHTLIQEEPLRKLCFNTYNGTLGKRKYEPVQDLQLDIFANGNEGENGSAAVGYLVKSGCADDLRKKLEKGGFVKQ